MIKRMCIRGACLAALAMVFLSFSSYGKIYEYNLKFDEPVIETGLDGVSNILLNETDLVILKPGHPMLPLLKARYNIPLGEKVVSITTKPITKEKVNGSYYIPFAMTPFIPGEIMPKQEPDSEIYESDKLYPEFLNGAHRIDYLHGEKVVSMPIYPIRFNPVSGAIEYYSDIEIIIETAQKSEAEAVALPGETLAPFSIGYSEVVSVPEGGLDSSREYLIVTSSSMSDAFQVLADFRETEQGGSFQTHMAFIEDIVSQYSGRDNAEKLRNYIRDSYLNYGTRYVLLGGDADGADESGHVVPIRRGRTISGLDTLDIPTDYYYACLDGSWDNNGNNQFGEADDGIDGQDIDMLAEVSVGRIAADDSVEANNHIAKIISYETEENLPYKVLLAGEFLYQERWGGHSYQDPLYNYLLNMPKTELYDQDQQNYSWSKEQLIDLINNNDYSMIVHTGHASVNYNMKMRQNDSSKDFDSVVNQYPVFITTTGCNSGSIDGTSGYGDYRDKTYGTYDSMAEVYTTDSAVKGAYAVIANTRYGWIGHSDTLQRYMLRNIFERGYADIGSALDEVRAGWDLDNSMGRKTIFAPMLFGDPASSIRRNCDSGALFADIKNLDENFFATEGVEVNIFAHIKNECGENVEGAELTISFDNGDEPITFYDDGADGFLNGSWVPETSKMGGTLTVKATAPGYESYSYSMPGNIAPNMEYFMNESAEYDWIDIIYTGTKRDFSDDMIKISLPNDFSFSFYGRSIENLYACKQGVISFNPFSCGSFSRGTNDAIPTTIKPNDIIAAYWDHQHQNNTSAGLYYKVNGQAPNRQMVVTWNDMSSYYNDTNTYQVILFENTNKIKVQHKTIDTTLEDTANGKSATVGIENADGRVGVQYSYNEPMVTSGMALEFMQQIECSEYSATISEHEIAGRVYSETVGGWWWNPGETTWFINGSGDDIGNDSNQVITLHERYKGYYELGECPTPDITPPEITLIGDNPVAVEIGSIYVESGATVIDNRDGDISSEVQITGDVDTSIIGTYYRYYNAADSAGNQADEVVRTVLVKADSTSPQITLLGGNPLTVYKDNDYVEPGYEATDNVDGDLTSEVIISGTVDTAIVGNYPLVYSVSDSEGNDAQVTRMVNVIEEPTCTDYSSTLEAHETAGRAYSETAAGWWWLPGTTTWYAVGSGENLGTVGSTVVILKEETEGEFTQGSCPGPDTTDPVITLLGDNPMTVIKGNEYIEPGATALDNVDGDISSQIGISGSVNTQVVGTYYIYYNVFDAAGNVGEEVRIVNVTEQSEQCVTADNLAHINEGRASACTVLYSPHACANGSGEDLGSAVWYSNPTTSIKETSSGYWVKVDNCQ